jgi:hypothetical protein
MPNGRAMRSDRSPGGQYRAVAKPADAELIDLLVQRDGLVTRVVCRDGDSRTVMNIAWGYDDGDEYAHITTNVSPDVPGASIDFFVTRDVRSVHDPLTGAVLLEATWP